MVLRVPDSHRIGIVPASDTGAMEMAMWSMLGARPVTLLAWESFGEGWVTDVVKQLEARRECGQGALWRSSRSRRGRLGRATSSSPGTAPPRAFGCPTATGSPPTARGLTIADATSAAFAMDLPWDKIDVATFSWQKVLGGEGGHGVLILSPRAVERLESYTPAWPLPKIFRITPDQRRQADRGHLPGRDDQHAVDARGRGLYLRARMGRGPGRPSRA